MRRNPLYFSVALLAAMLPMFGISESMAPIIMKVKPKLCVLNNARQSCQDKVVISWKSQSPRSLCLYSSLQEETLACWRESLAGETEQLIKTRESIEFYLKENRLVVAQQPLEVIKNFAKRNKRARKRHPWSIF